MRRFGALLAVALLALGAPNASAQVVTRTLERGTFVRYGLDALRLRLVSVVVRRRTTRGPHERGLLAVVPSSSGYLIVTLDLRNDGRVPENIPSFQTTQRLADGREIDPAVYGPFVGDATVEAPTSATIPPHGAIVVHLVIADVPNDRLVESVVFSPNDATPAYRYRLETRTGAPAPAAAPSP